MATRIDGKEISQMVKDELKERVKKEKIEATLAVIQVGSDPASTVYVGNKKRRVSTLGFVLLPLSCQKRQKRKSFWIWSES